MAVLSITIPDAQVNRVYDAFALTYGYSATLPNGSANPQTKTQFAKQQVINYIKNTVLASEAQAATNTAVANATTSVNTDIVLT